MSTGKLVIGTLSRIDPGKGLLELAQAVERLSPQLRARLCIWMIGDPTLLSTATDGTPIYEQPSQTLYKQLQEMASGLGSCLRLIEYQRDPNPYLQCMDAFYLGSHQETYSLAVIDAMLCALPILGAKSGGTIEQVGRLEERGFFFTPENVESLQNLLAQVLGANQSQLQSKGQAAQDWAMREHAWTKCLEQWMQLYQSTR